MSGDPYADAVALSARIAGMSARLESAAAVVAQGVDPVVVAPIFEALRADADAAAELIASVLAGADAEPTCRHQQVTDLSTMAGPSLLICDVCGARSVDNGPWGTDSAGSGR